MAASEKPFCLILTLLAGVQAPRRSPGAPRRHVARVVYDLASRLKFSKTRCACAMPELPARDAPIREGLCGAKPAGRGDRPSDTYHTPCASDHNAGGCDYSRSVCAASPASWRAICNRGGRSSRPWEPSPESSPACIGKVGIWPSAQPRAEEGFAPPALSALVRRAALLSRALAGATLGEFIARSATSRRRLFPPRIEAAELLVILSGSHCVDHLGAEYASRRRWRRRKAGSSKRFRLRRFLASG